MPRATANPDRLYTPQIVALQTIVRLSQKDARIPMVVKQHILANVDYLVTVLSNAQAGKLTGEIV